MSYIDIENPKKSIVQDAAPNSDAVPESTMAEAGTKTDEDALKNPEDENKIIQQLVDSLRGAIKLAPQLLTADLIIEAGVGTSRYLFKAIRIVFPKAKYVGTDLYFDQHHRHRGTLPNSFIDSLKTATEPKIICANVFDNPLIADLASKIEASCVLMISSNALFALLDNKNNIWDSKNRADRYDPITAFQFSAYMAQIHLANSQVWEQSDQGAFEDSFLHIEADAQRQGWETHRLPFGLLALNVKLAS